MLDEVEVVDAGVEDDVGVVVFVLLSLEEEEDDELLSVEEALGVLSPPDFFPPADE